MASTYPTTIDNFSNPIGTDKVNNAVAGLVHSTQHSNANDAIEALEAKVGANSSAVTTSHDYKLGEVTGSDKAVGKTATQTLTNKSIDADSNTVTNIDNGNIKTGADIARAKLASGTAGAVLINDGSGVMSEEAQLDISRGGTGQGTPTAAFDALAPTTTKGDLIVHDGTDNIRVGVGANNTVPVADSAEPSGIKWALVGTLGLTKIAIDTTSKDITSTGTLYTFSLPANTLSTNNAVRITFIKPNFFTGTNGTLDLSATYGGQSIGNVVSAGSSGGNSGTAYIRPELWLVASGATNTQKGFVTDLYHPITSSSQPTDVVQGSNLSMTVDSTSSQTFTITATITGGGGNAHFYTEGMIVELIA